MRRKSGCVAVLFGLVLGAQVGMLPVGSAAGAESIAATAKWETPGADIDLVILGPNKQIFKAQADQRSGPATETVAVNDPAPGKYQVGVVWQDDKPNMQVPVTVEVKQGDKVVGTFQAVLSAGVPNDRKIVATLNADGGGAAEGGAQAGGPGTLVAVAKWETPGTDIDLRVVGPDGEGYSPADDVQNGPGAESCAIANARPGDYKAQIVWVGAKAGAQVPVTVQVKMGDKEVGSFQATLDADNSRHTFSGIKVPGAPGPTLVATAKWETAGADVDLSIEGPNGEAFNHAQDVMNGPGSETCTITNARAGDYKARVIWMNDKKGVQCPVSIEVKLGEKVVGTFQATLDSDNDRRVFSGIKVAP